MTAGKPELEENLSLANSKAFNDSEPLGKNSDSSLVVTVLNSGATNANIPTIPKKIIMEDIIFNLDVSKEAKKINIIKLYGL